MANQPMPPSYMAYDRTIVVFSPDGRLLQVEYARQMVKNGTTAIGVKAADAVVLGTVKIPTPLAVTDSIRKIHKVDDHLSIVSSGSLADARDLVDSARVRAQINKITYGEPVSVQTLTTHLCDKMHLVTQYAGVRPYGVGLLVGGVDQAGPRLFETEPSGTVIEWDAQVIGRGSPKAKPSLVSDFKKNMEVGTAVNVLYKALKKAEKDANLENAEIVIVRKDKTEKLTASQLRKMA